MASVPAPPGMLRTNPLTDLDPQDLETVSTEPDSELSELWIDIAKFHGPAVRGADAAVIGRRQLVRARLTWLSLLFRCQIDSGRHHAGHWLDIAAA